MALSCVLSTFTLLSTGATPHLSCILSIVTNAVYCDHHYYCFAMYCNKHCPHQLCSGATPPGSCILSIVTKISVTNIITLTILPCNAIYCDQHYYCDYLKPRYCDQYCPHQLCAGQGSTAETRGLAGNLAPATAATAATQLHCYSCSLVTLSAGLTSAQHTLSFCQLVELYLGEMVQMCTVIKCMCTCE